MCSCVVLNTFAKVKKGFYMEIERRIGLFVQLGKDIRKVCGTWETNFDGLPSAWRTVIRKAEHENGWFTPENQLAALKGIALLLDEKSIREALRPHLQKFSGTQDKTVAVIMAGNIPAVNFLDFMCVLLSGFRFVGKLSSADPYWLPFLADELTELEPGLKPYIQFEKETIRVPFDAVIATGSNNTARYFEYYFGRYPHVIRKNRTSVAVLTGEETTDDFRALGSDISTFYGMGCRNVSKIFVPRGYDFIPMLQTLETFGHLTQNHKYVNNYEYHRSLFLLNGDAFYDNGIFLFQQNTRWGAPVGTVFYEYYDSPGQLRELLARNEGDIQCTAARGEIHFPRQVDLGQTQNPGIADYPDGVDVFAFLAGLV